jgi:5-methylthioadenosine/S-adenosylhomocysteine deaminase
MRTLIQDVTALTLDDQDRLLPQVDIALDGQTILAVGKIPASFTPESIIPAQEMLALPAFFNAHTHAAMTLERGWAEDLPFERWLNERIWVAESALEEEDVYWGASLAAAEMIRAGIVGFADHYFWMDQVAKVVESSGMKANLAWCHFGLQPEQELGRKSFEDTLDFVKRWDQAADGRILTSLGPHSPYMDSPIILRRFAEAAQRLGVGVHLHLSESAEQVQDSLRRYGLTPVAQVASTGLFDLPRPALVAHCNVLQEEDYGILADKGVFVAHTPKTYQKLAMHMPPILEMLRRKIKVALGTDGPASNSDLNLLEVMRLTGLYQKGLTAEATSLPVQQLLRLATQASVAALGFTSSGLLAPGCSADLLLIDTRAPHWWPRHDLAAGVVYTAHPGDIAYVWCNGQLLYRQGEFLTLDYDRIRFEAERRAFRMVGKSMHAMRQTPGVD